MARPFVAARWQWRSWEHSRLRARRGRELGWLLTILAGFLATPPYWRWLQQVRAAAEAGHPALLERFLGGIALAWALPALAGAPRSPTAVEMRRFPLAPGAVLGCRLVAGALQASTWLLLAILLPFAFTAGDAWAAGRDCASLLAFSLVCVGAWGALPLAAGSRPPALPTGIRWRSRSLFVLQIYLFRRCFDFWLTLLLLVPLDWYVIAAPASPVAYLFGLGVAAALLGSLALNQMGVDTTSGLLRYLSLPKGAAGLLRAKNAAWFTLLLVATLPLHLAALRWHGFETVGLGLLSLASSAGAFLIVGNYTSVHSPHPLRRCAMLSGGPIAPSLAALLAGAMGPVLGILIVQGRVAAEWLPTLLIVTLVVFCLRLPFESDSLHAAGNEFSSRLAS